MSSSQASAAGGTKRKRGPDTKYYAVHKGSRPGIYHDWDECLSQVKGFKGAVYKSFTSIAEAEQFLAHGLSSRTASKGPTKYYAVRSGKTPGVYSSWEEASAQINGVIKPRYKAFLSRAEAEAFVKGEDASAANVHAGTPDKDAAPSKKKKKARESTVIPDDNGVYVPGEEPLPADAEDGFDHRVHLDQDIGSITQKSDTHLHTTIPRATSPADDGMVKVYTDGSSRGNGTSGAKAGVGVYFGPSDKRNLAEPLAGPRQTNQRAELTAILRALELSPRDRPITIYSDSKYAIDCVTTWFQKWRTNGWVNSSKKPVENRDLIERIVNYIEERERISNAYGPNGVDAEDSSWETAKMRSFKKGRARVYFVWVKGHADDPGNVAADALAVCGSRKTAAE